METYNGHVRTPTDAIILFEACRLGLLPRVQRRLSEKERQSIRSGSVFVWDEREAGMRRWTDGKSWSASRVSGSFLTYREMEGKRGGSNFVQPAPSRGAKTPDSGRNSVDDAADGEEGPDGYRYKPDGLMKQSFSIATTSGQNLHLISYYSRSHPTAQALRQPSNDPTLASIQIPKGMYPESSVADQSNTPAVTRSPMPGAPNYVMASSPSFARQAPPAPYPYYPGFIPHPAGYVYPISPMHTPPGYALHPYAHHAAAAAAAAGLPPLGHPVSPFGPPPPPPLTHAPPSTYDQRPLRNSLPGGTLSPQLQSGSNPNAQTRSPTMPYQAPLTLERAVSAPQIDPRLTEGFTPALASGSPAKSPLPTPESLPPAYTRAPEHIEKPNYPQPPVTASQAPSLGALMNDHDVAATKPLTTIATTEITVPRAENERSGSTSPGGTKRSVPPQDIPSEKLGFREDMRALSKLDRVFARV